MILHHIADDTELIEVSSTPLRTERFFERYLNARNAFPVPRWVENPVAEP